MNLADKIETRINQFIVYCLNIFKIIVNKLVPKKWKALYKLKKYRAKKQQLKLRKKTKKRIKISLLKLKKANNLVFEKIDNFKDYPFKEHSEKIKNDFTIYTKTTPKRQILLDLIAFIKLKLLSTKNFFSHFDRRKKITLSSLLIITFAFFLYTKKKNYKLNRFPASVNSTIHRPVYKSFQDRTLKVQNIQLPLIVKNKKEIHSIIADFSIRTTTRFAKIFLDEKQYLIRDRFHTKVHALPSSFPLDQEGKDIIKDKIIRELNALLEQKKIEGKVENINIVFNIAN